MGMLKWSNPFARRRSRRTSDSNTGSIDQYEPESMPVRENFWAAYGRRVGLCAASVIVTAFLFSTNADTVTFHGLKGLLYLAVFAIFGVAPAILPFVWHRNFEEMKALQHRTLPPMDTGNAPVDADQTHDGAPNDRTAPTREG